MTKGSLNLASTRNTIGLEWEVGWQNVDDSNWEKTFTFDRYFNRFFSLFAGGFMEGENSKKKETKAVFGFHYLLPLNIESRIWVDTRSEARFILDREFIMTPRVNLEAEVQYDTKENWETSLGISYLLHQNISLTVQWHSEYQWGTGISVRF